MLHGLTRLEGSVGRASQDDDPGAGDVPHGVLLPGAVLRVAVPAAVDLGVLVRAARPVGAGRAHGRAGRADPQHRAGAGAGVGGRGDPASRETAAPCCRALAASAAVARARAATSCTGARRIRTWAPLDAQRNWQRVLTFPLDDPRRRAVDAWRYGTYWLIDVLVVGIVVIAVLAGVKRCGPATRVRPGQPGAAVVPPPARTARCSRCPGSWRSCSRRYWVIARAVGRNGGCPNHCWWRPSRGAMACSRRCSSTGGTCSEPDVPALGPRRPEPLGCAERTADGGACDDQGSHRGRPFTGTPRTPALPRHGRRHRGGRRGRQRRRNC